MLFLATLASLAVVWVWAKHPEQVAKVETRWIENASAEARDHWRTAQQHMTVEDWPNARQALTATLAACETDQIGDRTFGIWRNALKAQAKLATQRGEHEASAALLRSGLDRDPRNALVAIGLIGSLLSAKEMSVVQLDEAQALIEIWRVKLPDHPRMLSLQKQLSTRRGEAR